MTLFPKNDTNLNIISLRVRSFSSYEGGESSPSLPCYSIRNFFPALLPAGACEVSRLQSQISIIRRRRYRTACKLQDVDDDDDILHGGPRS
jgi:hypothetical protein